MKEFALFDNGRYVGTFPVNEISQKIQKSNRRIYECAISGQPIGKRWQVTEDEKHLPPKLSEINKYALWDGDKLVGTYTRKEIASLIGVSLNVVTNAKYYESKIAKKYYVTSSEYEQPNPGLEIYRKRRENRSGRKYTIKEDSDGQQDNLEDSEETYDTKIRHEVPLEEKSPLAKETYLARLAGKSYGKYIAEKEYGIY